MEHRCSDNRGPTVYIYIYVCVCCVCNMFKLLYMNLLQMKINNTAKFTFVVLESYFICSDKLTDQTLFRQTATFG